MLVEALSKGKATIVQEQSQSPVTGDGAAEGAMTEEQKEEAAIDELYRMLTEYAEKENISDSVDISKTDEYVFIRFSDNITFGGYSDTLNESGRKILDTLSGGLSIVDEYIEEVIIAGHTAEIESDKSTIDRTLSTERANAVLQYLESKNVIDPSKYLAIGYGLYSPIAENKTVEGRAKNRRVEIFISRNGHPVSYTNIIKETINRTQIENNSDVEYKKSRFIE
jgi:chemotaxis protein MotB